MEQVTGNQILDRLPSDARTSLLRDAKRISTGDCNFDLASRWNGYCIFMTKGFAIETVCLDEGLGAEGFMHGPESVTGVGRLLWTESHQASPLHIRGNGLAVPVVSMAHALRESDGIRSEIDRYLSVRLTVAAQLSACGRHHEATQRTARWLLMASDRLRSPRVILKQEALATYVGCRRTTISLLCGTWSDRGIIRQGRGEIVILDRERFETTACRCYGVCRNAFDSLQQEVAAEREFLTGRSA